MSVLSKLISKFNVTLIQIPISILKVQDKWILKFVWKNNHAKLARKTLGEKKSSEGGLALIDIKVYYEAFIIKTMCYWRMDR